MLQAESEAALEAEAIKEVKRLIATYGVLLSGNDYHRCKLFILLSKLEKSYNKLTTNQ
jgi:hypothetical protein